MRILIVCSRLTGGGAERVAGLWANGFAEIGHEVLLVSNLLEEQTYQTDNRVKLYNLVSTNNNKIKKWGSAIGNVRNIAKKEQPNVIIGVMDTCSLVSKLATIGMDIPVFMTEHYAFERPQGLSKFERFSRYYLNRLYQGITVLTQADLTVIGNRLRNVFVLPNPLSLEVVAEIPHKEKVILAAGRLDAWYVKGFDVLIKAFSKLVQGSLKPSSEELIVKSGGWKLQIAGTGSEKNLNYLKQLCKENGVEDYVEFLGFQKNIEKLYQKASIFVLSSRYEGFGLVLIEAMSQGCACIACDYKGRQREIIQNDSQGLCCEPDDVDALAEAMRKMMTDDQYRESVRKNAVERSKYYSLENTIQRWEKLLDKVVKKQGGR